MEPWVWVAIVVAAAVVGWVAWSARRTQTLRSRYATEYDRTVSELGRRRGEAELARREARVRELDIRPLSGAERDRYLGEWRNVQEQFVDDPKGAVTRGQDLVEDVLRARGYPMADFDRQVADLSVDHARVVENYRLARDITIRHRRGEASTEDLRQAMVLYRELFEDLLTDSSEDMERIVKRPVERDIESEQRVDDGRRRRPLDREVRP